MASVLTIAGSDSSGGAGIQCDVQTIAAMQCTPHSVITAITVQDQTGVHHVEKVRAETVVQQLDSVLSSFPTQAIKTGVLPTPQTIKIISARFRELSPCPPLVIDPVLLSTSGTELTSPVCREAMINELMPVASLITPNVPEAEMILNRSIANQLEAIEAAGELLQFGSKAVLLKGGNNITPEGIDILVVDNPTPTTTLIDGDFWVGRDPRGTGCAYASAIACGLARELDLIDAIRMAKRYVERAAANAIKVTPNYWLLKHSQLDQ